MSNNSSLNSGFGTLHKIGELDQRRYSLQKRQGKMFKSIVVWDSKKQNTFGVYVCDYFHVANYPINSGCRMKK